MARHLASMYHHFRHQKLFERVCLLLLVWIQGPVYFRHRRRPDRRKLSDLLAGQAPDLRVILGESP